MRESRSVHGKRAARGHARFFRGAHRKRTEAPHFFL
jgi:hypothetical protein